MLLRNTVLAAGAGVLLGIGNGATVPTPLEPEGEVTANVVVAGVEIARRGPVVVLLVDEAAGRGPNGTIDRAFILQVKKGETTGLNRHLVNVDVSWTPSAVQVRQSGVDLFSLALNSADVITDGTINRGRGLAQTTMDDFVLPDGLLEGTDLDDVIANLKRILEEEQCDCSAGGKNATSCSASGCPRPPTGCSVNCEKGALPCCGCINLDPKITPTQYGASCCYCQGDKKN